MKLDVKILVYIYGNYIPMYVLSQISLQISLIMYIASFSLGFGPLPWAVNAEMFPQEAKDKGSSLITL